MKFDYTAWIRNPRLPQDDEDYEWPLCFVLDAKTELSAKQWGDYFATKYASSNKEEFLHSSVEPFTTPTTPDWNGSEPIFREREIVVQAEVDFTMQLLLFGRSMDETSSQDVNDENQGQS